MQQQALDWPAIRLVVFDVDGTLYRQAPLRRRMALALLGHVATTGDVRLLRLLGDYRRTREALADAEVADFDVPLAATIAARHGVTPDTVTALVADWIETRPLPYLRPHLVPGIAPLFAALRHSGRRIGVLSDYPARAKIAALGLDADVIAAAADPDIGIMKPHPRGLQSVMAAAGATPATTLMIGDRPERDGAAARRAGVPVLIRSVKPLAGWQCFADFNDPLFAPVRG
jgi:putative hydrolase of the HAD superfamily